MSQSRLTLMRHGAAEYILSADGDFERSLTPTGVRDVTAMARWYHARNCRPDLILVSPAKRTRSTADILCHQFGMASDHLHFVPEIYDSSMETLLTIIRATDARITHLFLVGHNPSLYELSGYCLGHSNRLRDFAPGAIVEMLFECAWGDVGADTGTWVCARSPADQDDAHD